MARSNSCRALSTSPAWEERLPDWNRRRAVWMVASPCVRRCSACELERKTAGISAPRYRLRSTGGGSGNSTFSEAWCGAGGRNDIWYLDCRVYPQPEVTTATTSNEKVQRVEVRTSIPPPQTMKIKDFCEP